MTQDKARKAATRQRMAETGEPYSVARHAVGREHEGAAAEDPLGAGARHRVMTAGMPVRPRRRASLLPSSGAHHR